LIDRRKRPPLAAQAQLSGKIARIGHLIHQPGSARRREVRHRAASDASRVDVRVRGYVLDIAMGNADIVQVAVVQAVQGGPHLRRAGMPE